MTFDPCQPIHYAVNPSGIPDGGLELIRDAIREISAATGLAFTEDDLTQEPDSSTSTSDRALLQPERYGERWVPVLITWVNEAENPLLSGDVVSGVRTMAIRTDSLESARYVTGHIVLDREKLTDFLTNDGYAEARWIVLHALGRLVGLGAVTDRDELMHWKGGDWQPVKLGTGDRQGLATAGAGPCWTDP